MKKILFVLVSLVILFCISCVNSNINTENNTTVDKKDTTIAKQIADSILQANPGSLYNDVIKEDITLAISKYLFGFKERNENIPMINELIFEYDNVENVSNKYVLTLTYSSKSIYPKYTCMTGGVYCKIYTIIDRDFAKTLDIGQRFRITDCRLESINTWNLPEIYEYSEFNDSTNHVIFTDTVINYGTLYLKNVKLEQIK